jgi:excisionase family DNA binding protein
MNNVDSKKNRSKKRLYTVKEASIYLGRSECAVREMIWAGKIPYVKLDYRIYIDIDDLNSLIDRNKVRFSY